MKDEKINNEINLDNKENYDNIDKNDEKRQYTNKEYIAKLENETNEKIRLDILEAENSVDMKSGMFSRVSIVLAMILIFSVSATFLNLHIQKKYVNTSDENFVMEIVRNNNNYSGNMILEYVLRDRLVNRVLDETKQDYDKTQNVVKYKIQDESNKYIQTNITKSEYDELLKSKDVYYKAIYSVDANKDIKTIEFQSDSNLSKIDSILKESIIKSYSDNYNDSIMSKISEEMGYSFYKNAQSKYDMMYNTESDGYRINKDGYFLDPALVISKMGISDKFHFGNVDSDDISQWTRNTLIKADENNYVKRDVDINGKKLPQIFTEQEKKNVEAIKKINETLKKYKTLENEKLTIFIAMPKYALQDIIAKSNSGDYNIKYDNKTMVINDVYQSSILEQRIPKVMMIALVFIIITFLIGLIIPYKQQCQNIINRTYNKIYLEFKFVIFLIAVIPLFIGVVVYPSSYRFRHTTTMINSIISGHQLMYHNIIGITIAFVFLTFAYLIAVYIKYIYYHGTIEGFFKNSFIVYGAIKIATIYKNIISLDYVNIGKSYKYKVLGIATGYTLLVVMTTLIFGRSLLAVVLWIILIIITIACKGIYHLIGNIAYIEEFTNDISDGKFDKKMDENLGILSPIAKNINKIKTGFEIAVQEEVKSQNMKTQLISNVSHDLKTPLTSIITYTDLLKNEDIQDEKQKEYVDIIYTKAGRLKLLIEDLFEASKASSGDVKLIRENIDIISLFKQCIGEMSEQIEQSKLDFKLNLGEQKAICSLDGKRTYRIFSNIIDNIIKYSMKNTRVYIDAKQEENEVIFTFKNIASYEMNFTQEEIIQRFVRGEKSRTSQGSGLGLAIANSLVQLQGGFMDIEVDADLFKLKIRFSKVNG